MRVAVAIALFTLALWPAQALAVENFIPAGLTYGPGNNPLPSLNSDQEDFNTQVDIYESEIYTKQKTRKVFESQIKQFDSIQETSSDPSFIDY